ncbi:hypothetical protein VN97_g12447 [Penicillium thymicola]|uniref:Uncharacterized protein n=1 Tax=Penicillium thymicola TaxID=293382 RepID=A0AAI9T5G2_PENTH|nr:hypothetical protein VN97_g12447 [Penicillium thymicola]
MHVCYLLVCYRMSLCSDVLTGYINPCISSFNELMILLLLSPHLVVIYTTYIYIYMANISNRFPINSILHIERMVDSSIPVDHGLYKDGFCRVYKPLHF